MATTTPLSSRNDSLNGTHAAKVQEKQTAIAPTRRKRPVKKVKDEGLTASLCTLVCEHQIGMAF